MIFIEMHSVITDEEHMIWYMSIIRRVTTLDLEEVPPHGYMHYEQHVQQIQHHVSNQVFL